MSPEETLAAFVSELKSDDLPRNVHDRAGLTIADTLGAIVGGSTEADVRELAQMWDGTGTTTILGTSRQASAQQAAFCNGTAGTALELDEGHRFAAGHPAIHVLPALLAEAEQRDSDSEQFRTAFVAGYEVAVRAALAMGPLRSGYHPHGVWGPTGGAAGVARLRGFDAETTRHAMAIAANYAQHTRFEAATEGATSRNGYAGMANLSALVAADQAVAGVSGLERGVTRHLGLASAESPDEAELSEALGERWEVTRGYFKVHAACRYTHAVLDALGGLGTIDPDRVESVTVGTYPAAARLTEPRPQNALQAKFSIPFAVATALRSGETGSEAFRDDALDSETLALAERVTVTVDETMAARAPEQRGARVIIETPTESIEREIIAAAGGEHDPFSESQLREKFELLTAPVLGDERADALWAAGRGVKSPKHICLLARQ